jgi:TPR repeat protein
MALWPRLPLLAALLASVGGPALAQAVLPGAERIAVVVGNADYDRIRDLPNAANDALAMADMLRGFGYTVFAATNLDRQGFEELLRQAMLNAPDGSDIVFFYAGHGIQIGARNYLLPTDVDFTDVHDLPLYSITLDRVIDALSTRGAVHVAFIDACRDNPFPDLRIAADIDATLFETRAGFEPFRTPLNSLVAFSTAPGQVAVDGGDATNSPFTAAIVETAAAAPTENVITLLGQVREKVYNATGGAQVPWESSTLVAPFTFVDAETPADTANTPDTDTPNPDLGPDRGADALPPVTVTADLMLDRFVRLDEPMRAALDTPFESPAIVTAPRFGEIAIDPASGAVYLRPNLQELRAADNPDYRLTDRVEIETGLPDARRVVTLDLTLTPDACDMAAGDALDLDGVGLYRFPNEIDVAAALAACTASVAAHPDVARFHYQLGRAQRASTDFEAALASFETAVAGGHLRANNALAALLTTQRIDREVFDIPFDPDRATTLLEAAIAGGDPYAMQQRGITLTRNATTDEERRAGYELIDRAAEIGHTYAMNWLGDYHLEEDTSHFAPERGLAYFTASAAREDIYGYAGLAYAALTGVSGEPDFVTAYDYYRRAAEGGHPTAPASLGRMILRGEAADGDTAIALDWFDLGITRGDGRAAVAAANLLLRENADRWAPAYAAIRAAQGTLLTPSASAEEAREILAGINARDLGYALQKLLVALGEDTVIDGEIGQATLSALARQMDRVGLDPATLPTDPAERVIMAARVQFALNPVRPDVF